MKRYFNNPISKIRSQRRARCVNLKKNTKSIGSSELYNLVRAQAFAPGHAISTDDNVYLLLDEKVLKKMLKRDGTDKLKYRKEGGDCDDFAEILNGRVKEQAMLCDFDKGAAFGTVAGQLYEVGQENPVNHKMNIVVTTKREVWLVEPQNDKWFRPDKRNEYWYIIV